MTLTDGVVLLCTLWLVMGVAANYNIIWVGIHKGPQWFLTRQYDRGFVYGHAKLRNAIYGVAVLSYSLLGGYFHHAGYWFTVWLITIYLVTRVAAWIVLHKRLMFLKRRTYFEAFGPTGKHHPEIGIIAQDTGLRLPPQFHNE